MESATYVILALALAVLVYISVKTALVGRHVGFLRLVKALGTFTVGIASACVRFFAPSARAAASSEELELPEVRDHWTKTWDKAGAVAVPEQYLHHPDQEVSGLARTHFDDD